MTTLPLPVPMIQTALKRMAMYHDIYIPEYTWNNLRIDALIIDLQPRLIRGFEIKTSREDWKRDEKWTFYTQFCSSLSIVCPAGLISPDEVEKPFGLLWIKPDSFVQWVKRPVPLQKRNSLAWLWTYVGVIERELPRLAAENEQLKRLVDESWKESRGKFA